MKRLRRKVSCFVFQERDLAFAVNQLRIKQPMTLAFQVRIAESRVFVVNSVLLSYSVQNAGMSQQVKQLTDLMVQQPFQVVLAEMVVMRRSLLLHVSWTDWE